MLLFGQSGMLTPNWLARVAESRKKKPLEPLSMKLLSLKVVPWNWTENSPFPESIGSTVAEPSPLFDCVPMPNIKEPVTVACPESETVGNCRITPLLSDGNIQTGFCNCAVKLSTVEVHTLLL